VNIKSLFLFTVTFLFALTSYTQVKFSLATDFSVLRNFDKEQGFTVVGQTVQTQWHLDNKNSFYTLFNYLSNGKYSNSLKATAKSTTIQPQTIPFNINSVMKLRQFSLGIKRYLLGSFSNMEKLNLYGTAGFGLLMGKATNMFSVAVDTVQYSIQNHIANGAGKFKRLTFDLSAGWEYPVSYEIYIYSEARIHFPTTDYPNNYLLKNNNAPFTGSISLGFRILLNNDR